MTEQAELSHAVLLRVAEFLKKLPADQLTALANGDARIDLVPKGSRVTGATTRTKAAPAPTVDAAQVRNDLRAIDDRAAATRYIDDLRLLKPPLVALAKELGVTVLSKMGKDEIRDAIVQRFVGSRLAAEAVSRPAAARS